MYNNYRHRVQPINPFDNNENDMKSFDLIVIKVLFLINNNMMWWHWLDEKVQNCSFIFTGGDMNVPFEVSRKP